MTLTVTNVEPTEAGIALTLKSSPEDAAKGFQANAGIMLPNNATVVPKVGDNMLLGVINTIENPAPTETEEQEPAQSADVPLPGIAPDPYPVQGDVQPVTAPPVKPENIIEKAEDFVKQAFGTVKNVTEDDVQEWFRTNITPSNLMDFMSRTFKL